MNRAQIVVIAKEPVAGRVKTRLTPSFTPRQAAHLAAAALEDTLRAVAATPIRHRVLALDGLPGSWLPGGFTVIPQRGRGLDERLAAAFADAYRLHPVPIVLIGMDTPQVTPRPCSRHARRWRAVTRCTAREVGREHREPARVERGHQPGCQSQRERRVGAHRRASGLSCRAG